MFHCIFNIAFLKNSYTIFHWNIYTFFLTRMGYFVPYPIYCKMYFKGDPRNRSQDFMTWCETLWPLGHRYYSQYWWINMIFKKVYMLFTYVPLYDSLNTYGVSCAYSQVHFFSSFERGTHLHWPLSISWWCWWTWELSDSNFLPTSLSLIQWSAKLWNVRCKRCVKKWRIFVFFFLESILFIRLHQCNYRQNSPH